MSQLPPQRKYATRSSNFDVSLNSKLTAVLNKSQAKPKNAAKDQEEIKTIVNLQKSSIKATKLPKQIKNKDNKAIQEIEREISLLGKSQRRQRSTSATKAKTAKGEERGRANQTESRKKTVKRITKSKAQETATTIQTNKRQKKSCIPAADRKKSKSVKQAAKKSKPVAVATEPTLHNLRSRQSKKSNINEYLSFETEKVIQKALNSHNKRKAEQKKKGGKQPCKSKSRAKSVKTSRKNTPKTSRGPSRRGEKKTFAEKVRKTKSVAVSRKASRPQSQNTRKSKKDSIKRDSIDLDLRIQGFLHQDDAIMVDHYSIQEEPMHQEAVISYQSPKATPAKGSQIYNNAQILFIKDSSSKKQRKQSEESAEVHQINTCVNYENQYEQMQDDIKSNGSSQVNQQMIVPEQLKKSIALNLLSKETLEIIRKLNSNKPTPTVRPSLNYSFNKRVNSDKPTPVLESKLQEIRNGSSIISQINHSNFVNQSSMPQKSQINMFDFFQAPELSEICTPMKANLHYHQDDEEEDREEAKSEDDNMDETESMPDDEEMNEEQIERQQINDVIQNIKEEIKEDTRENSVGNHSPELSSMQNEFMMEVCDNLHDINEGKTSLQIKADSILSQEFKPRELYEDILCDNIQLPLPIQYKVLLNQFVQLDFNINMFRFRRTTPSFSALKAAIEGSLAKTFTVENFQQILTLAPNFFVHRWEAKRSGCPSELIIEIPKNIKEIVFSADQSVLPSNEILEEAMRGEVTEERKNKIKKMLYVHAIQYYESKKKEFMEKSDYVQFVEHFDPATDSMWPYFFEYNSAPAIPKHLLNEIPKTRKTETISDFLSKHDYKNTLMVAQSALSKAQEESRLISSNQTYSINLESSDEKQNSSSKEKQHTVDDGVMSMSTAYASIQSGQIIGNTQNTYDPVTGLSFETIRAIKQKSDFEEMHRKKNEEILETEDQKKQVQQLENLARQIFSLFTFQSTNCMLQSKVIEGIEDKQRGSFSNQDQLKEQIVLLTQLVPEWIQINPTMRGPVIKVINKRIQPFDIEKMIQERLNLDDLKRTSSLGATDSNSNFIRNMIL